MWCPSSLDSLFCLFNPYPIFLEKAFGPSFFWAPVPIAIYLPMAGKASRPAHAGAAHGMGLLGASCGRLLGPPWALPPARGLWPPAGAILCDFPDSTGPWPPKWGLFRFLPLGIACLCRASFGRVLSCFPAPVKGKVELPSIFA